ncbi:MAG: T9SS type A sorting domain-containing protein, partial [Cyclobacteriaceae bacterium]|nr:T9SS type A sorting domain-containing protein [Cyclobacteriaceae bacterium]
EDCGITFNNVLYDKTGSTLSTTTTSVSWVPSEENQWRKEYIDLTSLAGKSNLRFAFVATEYNGNNLYVDNIEFFIDNNPDPVFIEDTFSVYGVIDDVRLTFNLKERQPVTLQIYNSIGQAMLNNTLPETLNQTYYFDLQEFSSGIYIFKVTMGNEVGVARVYLGK